MLELTPTKIIVHCSATPPGMSVDASTIRRWHVDDNGWSDIGYHWIVGRDGTVEAGRPESQAGAHARGHNDSIGICLIGGTDGAGDPEANFTLPQYVSLANLIVDVRGRHGQLPVIGHRDVSDKACPSFNVQALLGELSNVAV